MKYEIKFCPVDYGDKLREFLHCHWKKEHILSQDLELLDWQHLSSDRYNFVIAEHGESKEIHAILGFIPLDQFDSNLQNNELWLAIWKVRDDIKVLGLGMSLLNFLARELKPNLICSVGLTEDAVNLYKRLGYKQGFLEHYYVANSQKTDFKLLSKDESHEESTSINEAEKLQYSLINSSEQFSENEITEDLFKLRPQKSYKYIVNRYLNHPKFDYSICLVYDSEKVVAGFVYRLDSANESRALRIVDYFGSESALGKCRLTIQELLVKYDAEYIDFYVLNFDKTSLSECGFISRRETDSIVPSYFSPYAHKNVELEYAFKSSEDIDIRIFKGDSDQDRPN